MRRRIGLYEEGLGAALGGEGRQAGRLWPRLAMETEYCEMSRGPGAGRRFPGTGSNNLLRWLWLSPDPIRDYKRW